MPREDFSGNSLLIKSGVVTCLLCASVKVTPLLDRRIFASENLDINYWESDFLRSVLCSSLRVFCSFNIAIGTLLSLVGIFASK